MALGARTLPTLSPPHPVPPPEPWGGVCRCVSPLDAGGRIRAGAEQRCPFCSVPRGDTGIGSPLSPGHVAAAGRGGDVLCMGGVAGGGPWGGGERVAFGL